MFNIYRSVNNSMYLKQLRLLRIAIVILKCFANIAKNLVVIIGISTKKESGIKPDSFSL